MRTSTVIVPIGSRTEVDRLSRVAAEAAHAYDVPMKIVHVVEHLDSYPTFHTRKWLEPVAKQHGAELVFVQHRSVSGGLRDFIVGDSDAVICMAIDATGGRIDGISGSVADELLLAGHHRFLLVGPEVRASRSVLDGPVVICVDGSDFSESILPHAAQWASTTSGSTWTVQVVEEAVPPPVVESEYVQSMAQGLGLADAEWEVLHGKVPADAIVEFAETVGAGSIAMATHGRTGVQRLALGSAAVRVAHRSPCPVLVRRPSALAAMSTGDPSTVRIPR